MDKWPKWLKYTIVWNFYVVAILMVCRGATAFFGMPFGVVGYA